MVGYNIEHMFDSGWSVRQKLRYLHTDVELNQVYAAGWLNETELNRGYPAPMKKCRRLRWITSSTAALIPAGKPPSAGGDRPSGSQQQYYRLLRRFPAD